MDWIAEKFRVYIKSADTLVAIVTFSIALCFLPQPTSAEIVAGVSKTLGGVALGLTCAMVPMTLKILSEDGERFSKWLDEEFDGTYSKIVADFKRTTGIVGFALLASAAMFTWTFIFDQSGSNSDGIRPSIIALYLGIVFYSISAAVQCFMAVIGFFERKRQYSGIF